MPSKLNNLNEIKKLDNSNMAESIKKIPLQAKSVMDDLNKIKIPANKKISNIVVCGMGGSSLGTHILKSLYADKIKFPIEIVNDYNIPEWVKKDTLCIISSYSGNTEEPLSCYHQAKKKNATLFILASGGKLKEIADKDKINNYIFNPKFNHCSAPRIGLGYSIFSQWLLFKKLNIIETTDKKMKNIISALEKYIKLFGVENIKNNPAKEIAEKLHNFIPIIFASNFLLGSAHTFANQINENAKSFSSYFPIPESNHHLLEGLLFPKGKDALKFLLIKSSLYHKRILPRYKITKQILKKNNIKFIEYGFSAKTKEEQIIELLALGSWASFYMALLNNINPTPIPNVDYFKSEMAKK